LTKFFTPFCRSRRADSKYIYFVGSLKVFFDYNYIIGGKNSMIVQIPCLVGTYTLSLQHLKNVIINLEKLNKNSKLQICCPLSLISQIFFNLCVIFLDIYFS